VTKANEGMERVPRLASMGPEMTAVFAVFQQLKTKDILCHTLCSEQRIKRRQNTQQNDTQQNDTYYNEPICDNSRTAPTKFYDECHFADCHFAECL
jgi:hypothetical protein